MKIQQTSQSQSRPQNAPKKARSVQRLVRPRFLTKLRLMLEDGLAEMGIPVRFLCEPVKFTRLWRIFLVSEHWGDMKPSEQQEVVWRLANRALMGDEAYKVAYIYAHLPDQMKTWRESYRANVGGMP